MGKFNTGQVVKCLTTKNPKWFTIGKIYRVIGHNGSGNPTAIADDGDTTDMLFGTFEPIEETIVVGDEVKHIMVPSFTGIVLEISPEEEWNNVLVKWNDGINCRANLSNLRLIRKGEEKMVEQIEVGDLVEWRIPIANTSDTGIVTQIIGDRLWAKWDSNGKVEHCSLDNCKLIRKGGHKVEKISAKKLLEMDACNEGFMWFVNKYGKGEIDVKEVYETCKEEGHTSYCDWIKSKFKVEEEKYRVGQVFEHNYFKMALVVNANNTEGDCNGSGVTMLSITPHRLNWHIVKNIIRVADDAAITDREMEKITGDSEWKKHYKLIGNM